MSLLCPHHFSERALAPISDLVRSDPSPVPPLTLGSSTGTLIDRVVRRGSDRLRRAGGPFRAVLLSGKHLVSTCLWHGTARTPLRIP